MSETAALIEERSATEQLDHAEQIDELATRLIINGPSGICAQDFLNLAHNAPTPALTEAANKLAKRFNDVPTQDVEAFTHHLNAGLDELRSLLAARTPEIPSTPAAGTPDETPAKPVSSSPLASLAEDEDLILEFITESNEHLANIEGHMLALEKDNQDAEILNAVFRAFHTIKGLAGFLEFTSNSGPRARSRNSA